MKKSIFLLAVLIFGIVTASLCSGESVIDRSVFTNPQRTESIFDHDNHNEKAKLSDNCAVCHHVYEGKKLVEDESSEDQKCSDCHSLKKNSDNSVALRVAFHKRCRDCHFKQSKGPVLCGECHIK